MVLWNFKLAFLVYSVVSTVAFAQTDDDDEPTILEVATLADGLTYAYDKVISIDDQNFKMVRETYPRLVLNFGKSDCSKCEEFKKYYGYSSTMHYRASGGSDAWAFGYVDIERSPVLKALFEITMYPLIFHIVEDGIFQFTPSGENRRTTSFLDNYFREWVPETATPAELLFIDDVINLHDNNWDMVWELSEESPVLLNVYAPWCAHCKDMAKVFADVAEIAEDLPRRPWTLAKMDGNSNKEAARSLSISQYPTLYIFHNDRAYRYTGGHLKHEMLQYLKIWRPDPNQEIDLRVDEFKDIKEEDVMELDDNSFHFAVEEFHRLCVFFYAPWCGHCKNLHPIFDQAASYLAAKDIPVQMVRVDATTNPNLHWKYNISSFPFVTVIEDGVPYTFRGKRSANGLANYLRYWEPFPQEVIPMNEDKVKKISSGAGSRRAANKRSKPSEPEAKVEILSQKEEL